VTPRQPGRVGRGRAEVRWFIPGEIDVEVRPRGRSQRRTDLYHLASLGPASSLKRRGDDGPLEWKARVGGAQPCEIAGVPGIAEHWVKRRLRPRDLQGPPIGEWIAVHKERWQVEGIEICRLELYARLWWTVSVPSGSLPKAARKALASWAQVIRANGEPASYPICILSSVAITSRVHDCAPTGGLTSDRVEFNSVPSIVPGAPVSLSANRG
jgi:hypothetical protein